MLLQYFAVPLTLLLMTFWFHICVGKIALDKKYAPGGRCMTPDKEEGNCVHWTKCEFLSQRISGWDKLEPYLCGFSGFQPRVCCILSPLSDILTSSPDISSPITNYRTENTTPEYRMLFPEPRANLSGPLDNGNKKPPFLPENCGFTIFSHNRVFGGQKAEKGSWPWMVAIFHVKTSGSRSPRCGGALVTLKHVITAAHCVAKRNTIIPMNTKRLMVRVGAYNLSKDNEPDAFDVHVASIQIHEFYDFRLHINDIAVLRLRQPIPTTNNTSPVCLPYDSLRDVDLTGKSAVVTGFGVTSAGDSGNYSDILMEVSFDIQDQEMCRVIFERDIQITDGHLCPGTLDGTKDSCQGDSGSPLVTIGKGKLYYLVGVVSFGKKCALTGYPGIYTRVTKHLDWLTSKLAD